MILHAKSGVRGELRDLDTGEIIRFVRWADTETGYYEAFRCDPAVAKTRGIPLASLVYRGRSHLQFTPTAILDPKPSGRRAPSTPLAEIRPEVLRGRTVRAIVWIPGVLPPECDEALCHRAAEWAVSIEQLVEPELAEDGTLYERAVMVDAGVYCSWHYRAPRQITTRGVEIELDNVKARPG